MHCLIIYLMNDSCSILQSLISMSVHEESKSPHSTKFTMLLKDVDVVLQEGFRRLYVMWMYNLSVMYEMKVIAPIYTYNIQQLALSICIILYYLIPTQHQRMKETLLPAGFIDWT